MKTRYSLRTVLLQENFYSKDVLDVSVYALLTFANAKRNGKEGFT